MGDALLLLVCAAAPLAYLLLTRSTTRMVLAVSFIVAIVGGVLQLSTGLGFAWSLQTIQWVLGVALILLVGLGVLERSRGVRRGDIRNQVRALWIPSAVLVFTLGIMRLVAGDQPSVLAGVSFLVNHGAAEDNAKWLNLTSQLAVGDALDFTGGYAGGALIVVMAVAATAARVVSLVAYGGVNEVGVTVHAVIGSSYLLIALAPLALAPLAESRLPPKGSGGSRYLLPAPTLWSGSLVLVVGSAALTFFGHMSLQLVLLMLTLWVTAFLAKDATPHGRLLATAIAVSAGVVWFPLNLLSLLLLAALIVGVIVVSVRRLRLGKRIDGIAWLIVTVTAIASWDGLVSSTLYALGIGGTGGGVVALGSIRGASVAADTATLFSSPGGTQVASSALVLVAAVAVVGAAGLMGHVGVVTRSQLLRFLPVALLAGYCVLIGIADGLLTASGENYATQKMAYATAIVLSASCLPLAIAQLSRDAAGMTLARWAAVGSIVFVLGADSLLPRAVASIGPRVWEQPAEGTPYWSTFEVQSTGDQPIAALPIACAFLPPGTDIPNGNVDGPLSYTCTRILVGMNGRDGRVGSLQDWLMADWLSNGKFWNEWAPLLAGSPPEILAKRVVLLGYDGQVVGFDTLQGLLARFPPPPA